MELLNERLNGLRLILASHSPRRRQLLEECGFDFVLADSYEVDECYPSTLEAEQVPLYLSKLKSEGYPCVLSEGEILITADTVVVLGNEVLGKPDGREGAMAMLRKLSGAKHTVVTGVTLRDMNHCTSFKALTDVWFRELSDSEIEFYVDNYKPFDKAGAYGIQEWIGYVGVSRIEGSFYNVMGLPVQMLYVELDKFVKN